MTILVTGGTGLVGSRLLRRFAEAGIECRGLVRAGGDLPDGVEPVVGDILDVASLAEAVDGVETIVHLAALFRTTDNDGIWKVNLGGTRNLIAAARERAHHARFILASTSNIYDFGAPRPGRETDDVHPTFAYPASKAAAETELKNSGLTWAVVRLPFVYGDGDGHLEAFRGASMHPAQRFSVMHHQDIAAAFRLALTGAMDGQVVNFADEAPATVYEMAAISGYEYPPSAEPLINPWRGQVDVSLARSLGFRPTIPTIHEAARLGRI